MALNKFGLADSVYPAFEAMVKATEETPPPCIQDPDLWWSVNRGEQIRAARHCLTCPMIDLCEKYLAASNEPHGVWAARLPEDRSKRVTVIQRGTAGNHRGRLDS